MKSIRVFYGELPPDGSLFVSILLFLFNLIVGACCRRAENIIRQPGVLHRVRVGLKKEAHGIPAAEPGRGLGIDVVPQQLRCKAMPAAMEGQPSEAGGGL